MAGSPTGKDDKADKADASAPKGATRSSSGDVTSGLPELDNEFARLMQAFDKVMHQTGTPAPDPEMDPELEQKLQQALGKFLATPRPSVPDSALDGENLDKALETHVRPLFDALFATALGHVKEHAEALKAGKEPPPKATTTQPVKVDLSSLFDPDERDED